MSRSVPLLLDPKSVHCAPKPQLRSYVSPIILAKKSRSPKAPELSKRQNISNLCLTKRHHSCTTGAGKIPSLPSFTKYICRVLHKSRDMEMSMQGASLVSNTMNTLALLPRLRMTPWSGPEMTVRYCLRLHLLCSWWN